MEKTSELSKLLDDLADCGRKLAETVEAIRDFCSSPDEYAQEETRTEQKQPAPPEGTSPKQTKTYTKEEVRAILAGKANEAEGRFRKRVRNIVRKYGNGGSLTDIDPADYPAVVKEAEELADA